ncbi:hypothetical protein T01_6951 [Trichinella spiralis]|uniref:Transmembrane protein n=1 Tax=Trichinella spiralis TaxID=6334 RepID=A0A0V1AWS1_TRISP|nr:hypothetical protein T01_6951 [Trichinella spiralis]
MTDNDDKPKTLPSTCQLHRTHVKTNTTVIRLRSSCPILPTVALVFLLFVFCRNNFASSVHVRYILVDAISTTGIKIQNPKSDIVREFYGTFTLMQRLFTC